jgi:FixJ family two-component response regulator
MAATEIGTMKDASGNHATQDHPIVFIVDDDYDVRRGLQRLVRSVGWHAEAFSNAHAFLARLPYAGVGCILLDIQMPGMSGPELQKALRDRGISLPIVYLTGHGDVPSSVDAMKSGAIDFLLKPADETRVMSTVGAAIERHISLRAEENKQTQVVGRLARLSARERQVMEAVIAGRLNKQIAGDLGITEKTVKAHRARVMEKLETRSVAGLVRMCMVAETTPSLVSQRDKTH